MEVIPDGNNVPKLAFLVPGGIKTPNDIYLFSSLKISPRSAEKSLGRYVFRFSPLNDARKYVIEGFVSNASLSNLLAASTLSAQV